MCHNRSLELRDKVVKNTISFLLVTLVLLIFLPISAKFAIFVVNH